jgi:hypothetical protein
MFKIDDVTVEKVFTVTFEYEGKYGFAVIRRLEGSNLQFVSTLSLEGFENELDIPEDIQKNIEDNILYHLRADKCA